jgi:hypothetical protein
MDRRSESAKREKPASLRAFLLPTESTAAEAEGYARSAITIAAAVAAIIRSRSVAVASVIRSVGTIAVVPIAIVAMTIVTIMVMPAT